jgi:hypothetical protein
MTVRDYLKGQFPPGIRRQGELHPANEEPFAGTLGLEASSGGRHLTRVPEALTIHFPALIVGVSF